MPVVFAAPLTEGFPVVLLEMPLFAAVVAAGEVWVASRSHGGSAAGGVALASPTWIIHLLIVLADGVLDQLQRVVEVAVGSQLDFPVLVGETLDQHVYPHAVVGDLTRISYFFAVEFSLQKTLLRILTQPHFNAHQLIEHRVIHLVRLV